MKTTLRLTDTNAASDSGGRTWGLEGNLVWWLIGGLGGGIAVFFLMVVGLNLALLPALGLAVIPVLVVVGYIFLLRHGKPPGYDRDVLESVLGGCGFGPEINQAYLAGHPLGEDASLTTIRGDRGQVVEPPGMREGRGPNGGSVDAKRSLQGENAC